MNFVLSENNFCLFISSDIWASFDKTSLDSVSFGVMLTNPSRGRDWGENVMQIMPFTLSSFLVLKKSLPFSSSSFPGSSSSSCFTLSSLSYDLPPLFLPISCSLTVFDTNLQSGEQNILDNPMTLSEREEAKNGWEMGEASAAWKQSWCCWFHWVYWERRADRVTSTNNSGPQSQEVCTVCVCEHLWGLHSSSSAFKNHSLSKCYKAYRFYKCGNLWELFLFFPVSLDWTNTSHIFVEQLLKIMKV